MAFRPRPWPTAIAVVGVAILLSLGTWQLHRKAWKEELLATIAQEAIELIGGPDRARIKQCEGDGCALLFLDLSRPCRRRWCSMAGCGNRAKARQFRRKERFSP